MSKPPAGKRNWMTPPTLVSPRVSLVHQAQARRGSPMRRRRRSGTRWRRRDAEYLACVSLRMFALSDAAPRRAGRRARTPLICRYLPACQWVRNMNFVATNHLMTGPTPDTRFPIPGVNRSGFLRNFITRPTIRVGDSPLRRSSRAGAVRGERALPLRFHRRRARDRAILFDRRRDTVSDEWWKSSYELGDDLSLSDLRPRVGDGDAVIVADEGRHHRRQRRLDRLWLDHHAGGADRRRGDRRIVFGRDEGRAALRDRRRESGRVIRYRFDEATIAALLALRWWDWDIETITARLGALCSDDVASLLAYA